MRPISEILSDALARFEGGKRWTTGALWRDDKGEGIAGIDKSKNPAKFCAYGAIVKSMMDHGEYEEGCTESFNEPTINKITLALAPSGMPNAMGSIVSTNDRAITFETVKQMFCQGIQRALEQEQAEQEVAHEDKQERS